MILISITTSHGCIEALLADAAPATVANFCTYIRTGAYTDGAFWRTVTTQPDNQPQQDIKIDVIQATCHADVAKRPGIAMEQTGTTGLRHRDGTLSMARFAPDRRRRIFSSASVTNRRSTRAGFATPTAGGSRRSGKSSAGWTLYAASSSNPPTNNA